MKKTIRPAIFKWRQTEPELILCAVRGYLRYSLSFRDVEELLSERGLKADHTTIWRWIQRYGPELLNWRSGGAVISSQPTNLGGSFLRKNSQEQLLNVARESNQCGVPEPRKSAWLQITGHPVPR